MFGNCLANSKSAFSTQEQLSQPLGTGMQVLMSTRPSCDEVAQTAPGPQGELAVSAEHPARGFGTQAVSTAPSAPVVPPSPVAPPSPFVPPSPYWQSTCVPPVPPSPNVPPAAIAPPAPADPLVPPRAVAPLEPPVPT